MKKLYVDHLKNVMEFDYNDMPTHRDEETDRIVANTPEDYDWMVALNEAIEFLEENFEEADYIDEINEYSDYKRIFRLYQSSGRKKTCSKDLG